MIQNYLVDSLPKKHTAPSYPIFISLQNSLNAISSKKTLKDAKADIVALVQRIGFEAEKFVLSQLIDSLEFPECKQKPSGAYRVQLLSELIKEYSGNVRFLSYFPEVLTKINKEHKLSTFLSKFLSNLKIPLFSQIAIALSLYLSDKNDFSEIGQQELVKKLIELKKNNKATEMPDKIIDELLFQISRNPELTERLDQVYNYLLEACQAMNKANEIRIYNYFKGDWQFFANQPPIVEKPPSFFIKKVNFLCDLGPSCTHQIDTLKTVMSQIGNLNQEDIFECIMMMAQEKGRYETGADKFVTDLVYANKKNIKNDDLKKIFNNEISNKKNYVNWNIDNFLTYCTQTIPSIKWHNIVGNFDRPKLAFTSEEHFYNLMKIIEKVKKIGQKWKMPEALYFKKWMHPASQAAFLIQVFKCKEPECLQLHEITTKRIQKSVKDESSLQKQLWGHIDLVELLFESFEHRYMQIRELFDYSMTKYPQLLLLTLSEIKPSKGQALVDEIFSQLLPKYLHNHSANIKLIQSLWETNQELIIRCICEISKAQAKKDHNFNFSRILDITQSIKDSLLSFTNWNDLEFSIPLAVIAGKREFFNFEPWLTERIQILGSSFVKAILQYIDNNLMKPLRAKTTQNSKENILEKAQLNVELLNKIFFTIMTKVKKEEMSPRNSEFLKRLYKQCCAHFPQIADGNIPDEIEKETEKQMNKIYKEELSVKEAVEKMKKLKNSKKQTDQDQLACHLTFLCSELTYHYSYPERELMITAQLFAGIINANLIQKKIYQMFLHVLESDLQEDNSKYIFAITVMQKIKTKLCHESWFCENLLNIELIMKKNPEFVEELIKAIQPPKTLSLEKEKKLKEAIRLKNNPPPQPATIVTVVPVIQQSELPTEISMEPSTVLSPLKKVQLNDYDILTFLDKTKQISVPDKEAKVSKINMICNTLSLNNVDEKAKQLQKILDCPQAYKLLAYNMLFKRVSISQNNGVEIFSRLVDKLPEIEKPVVNLTYRILQKWFALTGKSINDKKFNNFKNIGSWLGRMTIGRGTPIPIHKLHLKNILITTFAKSSTRLSMNISVVLKILEFINLHPQIFRSTSPWLSRLIGTINQIQEKIKDDQTTKAEIKAFFKSILIKVDSIPIPPTSYLNNNRIIISQLDRYIVVDEEMAQYYSNLNIDLKMIITRAVDDSIQEIVEPVIDRAVKIAKVTTKQLILKDFALQPSADKFRQSSYNVVKNMAGPLAHVTCRQPLKASMNRSLKNLLSQHISDSVQIDSIIQKAIPDNLDFGCTLIKQAVIESAEDSIKKDSKINEAIADRLSAQTNNTQFKDEVHFRDIPSIVPEQLRPRPGGLSDDELLVYKQFKNDKIYENTEKFEETTNLQKLLEIVSDRGPIKAIQQILQADSLVREQFIFRIHSNLVNQSFEESQFKYYVEVCQKFLDFIEPKECWRIFKEVADLKRKETHFLIKKLVREKYLPESSLSEIDEANEQENKIVMLFEKWLETAHEKIEPYLRTLEDMFNHSENQIRIFFSHSLFYAMQKVEESFINNPLFDTNYIEDYSKLIIISYKTIASSNCNLYLEHTIKAILEVFDKLQGQNNELSFQRPFFKLFSNLIGDVTRKEYDIDQQKIMTFYSVLAKELEKIAPLNYPGFSFAWVELIGNRNLMPALLETKLYWELYYKLLKALFKFMRQYITEENLADQQNGEIYQVFYKGVFKLLIVIIHDFSDFLSAYSLQLCLIPGPRFTQITNMIISAYPKGMRFEFPFKIESKAQLIEQVERGGEPKYHSLSFDKKKYNQFLKSDPRDEAYQQRLAAEQDEKLQIFMLYAGWFSTNSLSRQESYRKVKELLIYTKDGLKKRMITFFINLIRYPNTVTLLFIQISMDIIFNQSKETETRNVLLNNIIVRMGAENPQAWGLDYLVRQLIIQKSSLMSLNVPKEILKLL